jgi:flagellar hook assembly protein FlgD
VQIEFQLPRSQAADAEIFDVAGRRTRTLFARQVLGPGSHASTWDGRDAAGAPAPAGLYLIRVRAGSESRVARVVLLGL